MFKKESFLKIISFCHLSIPSCYFYDDDVDDDSDGDDYDDITNLITNWKRQSNET